MNTLKLYFTNHSGINVPVSIGFFAGLPLPDQPAIGFDIKNLKDGSPLKKLNEGATSFPFKGNWYTLEELSNGIGINTFNGRIYVCYGDTWVFQSNPNAEPAQAVTDSNFFLRYDKMEMTYTGSVYDVADLTSIDYWSIPMTLNTYQSSISKTHVVQTVNGLLNGATTKSIYTALNKLTTPPVSGLPGLPGNKDYSPLPALVPGDYVQFPGGPAPGTAFARIIGPSSYPPCYPTTGVPVTPYDLFIDYLTYLKDSFGEGTGTTTVPGLGNGVIGAIKGSFAGVGPVVPPTGPLSKQTYDLTATIDNNLNILLKGTVSGVVGTTTMAFTQQDLSNPIGIYGGNAPFCLNGSTTPTPPANDVYGWASGDLFAGFNTGAVGSKTVFNGSMVGALTSQQWFKIPPDQLYGNLQSKNNYYNQWAATLQPLTQAYNFAYTDRFAPVFVSLNPATIDTLEVVLEDTSEVV